MDCSDSETTPKATKVKTRKLDPAEVFSESDEDAPNVDENVEKDLLNYQG